MQMPACLQLIAYGDLDSHEERSSLSLRRQWIFRRAFRKFCLRRFRPKSPSPYLPQPFFPFLVPVPFDGSFFNIRGGCPKTQKLFLKVEDNLQYNVRIKSDVESKKDL